MNPEELIRATFEDYTRFEISSLPNVVLDLDVPDIEEDESDMNEFVEALANFMQLTDKELRLAIPYLFAEFKEYEDNVDPSCIDVSVSEESDIWNELKFTGVNLVRRGYGDKAVYVQLTAECSWDEEHGIQLIFRKGKELSRVSDQDGHYAHCDAFGLPESEDCIR